MSKLNKTQPKEGKQPSKKLRREVRDNFDADALAHLCETWDFTPYAVKEPLDESTGGRERFYWYQDNGSDVLAIAHLDSVQSDGQCQIVDTAAGLMVTSGTLDDRLGAYVILELLPRLGVKCDILLTTDEEMCASTAEDFWPDKRYNWMFSFDRGGTDVVMYDYETKELKTLVEDSGAQVGVGSFSDICVLDHLGCAGFNWGVGYEDYHSRRAHAWLDDTFRMVARFVKFYRTNKDKALVHVPAWRNKGTAVPASSSGGGWSPYSSNWWLDNRAEIEFDDDDLAAKPDNDETLFNGWLTADCGHEINIDDESTYLEAGMDELLCNECGGL